MIDLSMYADKAAQLSSPLSRKAGVKIRAPSPSLLPPRPPIVGGISSSTNTATAGSSGSGSHIYKVGTELDMQYDDDSLDLQGTPNGKETYTFMHLYIERTLLLFCISTSA